MSQVQQYFAAQVLSQFWMCGLLLDSVFQMLMSCRQGS